MPKTHLMILLSACLLFQGCATTPSEDPTIAEQLQHDRRSAEAIATDREIEAELNEELHGDEEVFSQAHVNINAYNGAVLVTGEATTQPLKDKIIEVVRLGDNVRLVHNNLAIAYPSDVFERNNDANITDRLRAALDQIRTLPGFDPGMVKVVVERGAAYLMGRIYREEGTVVINVVRHQPALNKSSPSLNTLINPQPLPNQFLGLLAAHFARQDILTAPEDCWAYGYDNSRRHKLPQAVVFATSHEQVVSLVKACNQYKIALTARGRGTGTTGATVPLHGGVVLSLERMDKLVEFSRDNRYITVEPGITNQQVQDIVKAEGFFWPPDPTSAAFCSIGGNLAYNSAGPRAVKYGTPRENTLALRAVTGAGEELRVGVYTTKGVVGYDLTRLIIGSEGTLAIITEATLKLTPLPEATKTLRAVYSTVFAAAEAIAAIMAQPIVPCALEFIDGNAINMIRQYSSCDLPEQAGAILMIEVDGQLEGLDSAAQKVADSAKNAGLLNIRLASTDAEVKALWQTRKALSPALRKVAPKKINEDVVVPVTEIPALISGLDDLSKKYQLPIINFGHAGNGNIHVNLLLNPDDPVQSEKAHQCLDEVFSLVLKLNGTLSGEHGVGLEKRDFVARELDSAALQLMRNIKAVFDPNGILNPDKMLPLV